MCAGGAKHGTDNRTMIRLIRLIKRQWGFIVGMLMIIFLTVLNTVTICNYRQMEKYREIEKKLKDIEKTLYGKKSAGKLTGKPSDSKSEIAGSIPARRANLVYWKTVRAYVTAYEPSYRCCGRFADGKTSTGTNAWRMNGVATYKEAIPHGTYMEIPGIGIRVSDDTGRAMRDSWKERGVYHIDVRMTYYYQARRWGHEWLNVKLYKKKK